ncbi:DNA polymerase V subunit UmuD [mine drainage metagenome]|uniref:DNA polymerase V subunit UmuD n=1 Tax=mine drainage metagenome TaxID=410659 RepID=A0A1J5TFZ6_9ZZZZ
MQTRKPIGIPVVSAPAEEDIMSGSNCSGNELVALMALGDSMTPEFDEGDILVIELGRPPRDGSYVIAEVAQDDYIFRQLQRDAQGGWLLHALNPAYADTPIASLDCLKGVVIHKRHSRSRKTVKFYEQVAS